MQEDAPPLPPLPPHPGYLPHPQENDGYEEDIYDQYDEQREGEEEEEMFDSSFASECVPLLNHNFVTHSLTHYIQVRRMRKKRRRK